MSKKTEQRLFCPKNEEIKEGINKTRKRMKSEFAFISEYADIGDCYEFSFLYDDTWKKDYLFCLFAERIIRNIAVDMGIPPEKIAFGKWGARLIIDGLSDDKLCEYVWKIENHPSFKGMVKACKIATGGETTEFNDLLNRYKESISNAFETHFSNPEIMKFGMFKKIAEEKLKEAKDDMQKKEFQLLIENLNSDLSWAKINSNGIVKQKNPFEGVF